MASGTKTAFTLLVCVICMPVVFAVIWLFSCVFSALINGSPFIVALVISLLLFIAVAVVARLLFKNSKNSWIIIVSAIICLSTLLSVSYSRFDLKDYRAGGYLFIYDTIYNKLGVTIGHGKNMLTGNYRGKKVAIEIKNNFEITRLLDSSITFTVIDQSGSRLYTGELQNCSPYDNNLPNIIMDNCPGLVI